MTKKVKKAKKTVVACRKKCKANGTGLSHYIAGESNAGKTF